MALPSITELPQKTVDAINDLPEEISSVSDNISTKIEDTLKDTSDNLVSKITGPFESVIDFLQPTALAAGIGGLVSSITPPSKKILEESKMILQDSESLYNDQKDILLSIDSNLENIFGLLRKDILGDEFDEEKQKPTKTEDSPEESIPEEASPQGITGSLIGLLAGIPFIGTAIAGILGTGIISTLAAVFAGAGIVSVVAAAVTEGFFTYFKAKDLASEIGVGGNTSGITSIFTGLDGDILSSLGTVGRWATAGAIIGSVVPVFGTITGGIIGAAIGAIVTGLTNWLGFDNVARAVQGAVDFANTAIESVFGTDVERIKGRIKEIKSAKESNNKKLAEISSEIKDAEMKLSEARSVGDKETVRILEKRLTLFNEEKEKINGVIKSLDENLEAKTEEMNSANSGFIGGLVEMYDTAKTNTLAFGSTLAGFPGDISNFFSEKTEALKTLVSGLTERVSNSLGNLSDIAFNKANQISEGVKNFFTGIFDSISEKVLSLLTEVENIIFDKIPEFFDSIKNKALSLIGLGSEEKVLDSISPDNVKEVSQLKKNDNEFFTAKGIFFSEPEPILSDNEVADNVVKSIEENSEMVEVVISDMIDGISENIIRNENSENTNNTQNVRNTQNVSNSKTVVINDSIPLTRNPDSTIAGLENGPWNPNH